MASIITHPAVPIALGLALGSQRISWRLFYAGIICSIIPDLDVLTFRFGIAYASPYGHRGITHSIIFAILTGIVCALLAKRLNTTALKAFLFTAFATVSHGLLDALTTGGLGVEFFWPFNNDRYFFPWQVIQVSPLGLESFWTERGWLVVKSELLIVWLPCLLFVTIAHFLRLRKHHD